MSSTEPVAPAPAQEQAPEPKKAGIGKRILTYIVGLIVVGAGVYAFNYFTSDVAQAKVGDCASVTGTTSSPQYKVVECGSGEANYTIGKSLGLNESCGNDSYSELTESARRGPKTKLCIAPIFTEGKCYSDSTTNMDVKAVECSGSKLFKVNKVVKEAAAPQCAEGEQALTYPELKLNYCVGLPA
ncbi:LppU/SCO3897 family protein [Lentzea nigeriaca]|uniref:LppU/SCO3897 family protein n=1 Tax=Lentzea nigeriaca TaxID=1128665 RepID=UPI0019587EA0|nr:hypothetical protein [Lentzea nigeriaca]MBM7858135.1 hypothetical protein [Lentzea nigeriaca]